MEKICRLCFMRVSISIEIFSAEGICLNIAGIIRKHFQDEVNKATIVVTCYSFTSFLHRYLSSGQGM